MEAQYLHTDCELFLWSARIDPLCDAPTRLPGAAAAAAATAAAGSQGCARWPASSSTTLPTAKA